MAHDGPPANGPGAGAQLTGYELLGELGRGGMGVVYKARHLALDRVVAVKMILAGGHASAEAGQRFRAEAMAVARLQHPNIVQIHEVGEGGGHAYLTLEYCDGGSLDRKLAGTPLPPREAARLVETLASAMARAHEKGIVHRDLKPANVLLAGDGVAKITDFGLAKQMGSESGQTRSGAIVGTPSYMAPEQAEGKKDVGPAADIYALGAILYECLTGRPPFRAATALDTILQVVTDEPVPVRRLQPAVPADLETICHKCLRKDPAKRYAGAAALADDLRRFQAGEPVAARPPGRLELALRWVRRHPAVTALSVVSLAAMAAFVLLIGRHNLDLQRALDLAEEQERRALAQGELARRREAESRRLVYGSTMSSASEAYQGELPGRVRRLRLLLNACVPKEGHEDLRGFEWRYLLGVLNAHRLPAAVSMANVRAAAASPDGRWLAVGNESDGKGTLRLLRAADGGEAWARPTSLPVARLAFSPDGGLLAVALAPDIPGRSDARTRGPLIVHKVADGAEVCRTAELRCCSAMGFSADGGTLLAAELVPQGSGLQSAPRRVLVLDPKTGKQLGVRDLAKTAQATAGNGLFVPRCAAFSTDGKRLAVAGQELRINLNSPGLFGAAMLLDVETGLHVRSFTCSGQVTSVTLTPGQPRLLTAGLDNNVQLWDAESGKQLWQQRQKAGYGPPVAASPDGKRVAVANATTLDGEVVVRDAASGEALHTILADDLGVRALAWLPDGDTLVTASSQHRLQWWDVRKRLLPEHFGAARQVPTDLAAVHGGKTLVVATALKAEGLDLLTRAPTGSSGNIGLLQWWDVATQTLLASTRSSVGPAHRLVTSPDGKALAFVSEDGALRLWDVAGRKEMPGPPRLPPGLRSAGWSPDGRQLVLAAGRAGAVTCDVGRPDAAPRTIGGGGTICNVAWSPDGTLIAASEPEGTTRLIDPGTGRVTRRLPTHVGNSPNLLAFSGDGKALVTDGVLAHPVWDVATGRALAELVGHVTRIQHVALSPDGRRVVTAADIDATVKVWDRESGADLITFWRQGWVPRAALFLPDGEALAVAWQDKDGYRTMELSIYRARPARAP